MIIDAAIPAIFNAAARFRKDAEALTRDMLNVLHATAIDFRLKAIEELCRVVSEVTQVFDRFSENEDDDEIDNRAHARWPRPALSRSRSARPYFCLPNGFEASIQGPSQFRSVNETRQAPISACIHNNIFEYPTFNMASNSCTLCKSG